MVEVESVLSALHRRQKEYAVYLRELEALSRIYRLRVVCFVSMMHRHKGAGMQGHAFKTVTHGGVFILGFLFSVFFDVFFLWSGCACSLGFRPPKEVRPRYFQIPSAD